LRKPKLFLALGGGAARGLAHLGVLRVFEAEKITIDGIAGTSMGSMVGAMYAADPRIEKVIRQALQYMASPEFVNARVHFLRRNTSNDEEEATLFETLANYIRRGRVLQKSLTNISFLEKEDLDEVISIFLEDRDISSFILPLAVVATDLKSGNTVELRSGPVRSAVAASSAIPGAFPPIEREEGALVDGGLTQMVPVPACRKMGADFVVAVNVTHELSASESLKRSLEMYFRAHQITQQALIRQQLNEADIVLTPKVGHIHWADFRDPEKIIAAGEEVAKMAVQEIKRRLSRFSRTPAFMWNRLRRPMSEIIA